MVKKLKKLHIIAALIVVVAFAQASQAVTVTIEADKQDFQVANNTAQFNGNVRVNFDNVTIRSTKAILTSDDKGEPEKAVFTEGASATMKAKDSNDDLKAESITLLLASSQLIARGNSYSQFKKGTAASITVKADTQEFNNKTNEVKATGNVVVHYKDMVISGGQVILVNSEQGKAQRAKITGNAKIVRGDTTISAGNISIELGSNDLNASGGVSTVTTLAGAGRVSMTSSSQVFDKSANQIIGTGSVKVIYQDYVATGPKATLNLGPDNSLQNILFTGRSEIKDSMRKVSADVIKVSINPKNFNAEGNVKTQFIKKQISTPAATPAPTTPTENKPEEQKPGVKPVTTPSEVLKPDEDTIKKPEEPAEKPSEKTDKTPEE